MAQRRHCSRKKLSEIDAEVGEAEHVSQRPLLPARHPRRKGLRIVGRLRAQRCFGGDDCNGMRRIWHAKLGCMRSSKVKETTGRSSTSRRSGEQLRSTSKNEGYQRCDTPGVGLI